MEEEVEEEGWAAAAGLERRHVARYSPAGRRGNKGTVRQFYFLPVP